MNRPNLSLWPPPGPSSLLAGKWMKAVAAVARCLFSMYIISHGVWTGCFPIQWFVVTLSASWMEHCFHADGEPFCLYLSLGRLFQHSSHKLTLKEANLRWKTSESTDVEQLSLHPPRLSFGPNLFGGSSLPKHQDVSLRSSCWLLQKRRNKAFTIKLERFPHKSKVGF